MNASVRVAVVARSEVARSGLARMLEDASHVRQYSVFEPEEFTASAREDAIQLLILSCDVLALWCVTGPGPEEDAWADELAAVARRNGIRVVLILPGAKVQRAASGEGVPCDGVLDQNALTTRGLDDALRRLSGGERILPQPTARTGAGAPAPEGSHPAGTRAGLLTERERQIIELLVEGLSNKQIGHALGVSEHAAKRAVAVMMSKLDCPNRTQAVVTALREGLVSAGVGPHV
ncbi:response regulator transcription factor [Streptomyces sp. NPDC006288]|uniref:helix-turn-helix transcriptional regulator n=1 Tax=Streptomyces sp. NPDC006288 TaxID=3156743 RepID=UPI0033B888C2